MTRLSSRALNGGIATLTLAAALIAGAGVAAAGIPLSPAVNAIDNSGSAGVGPDGNTGSAGSAFAYPLLGVVLDLASLSGSTVPTMGSAGAH
ncbi:hypothetical protein [Nocardia sp. NBC_01327]|uniref:hypothetical protein n=1 Tax=Nocardia sp. NBC_01327 TaxID=2903593 RepID=UPI002E135662|nr:hypothetical protein OG326_12620 [Nocardia sp. NBC_01327]